MPHRARLREGAVNGGKGFDAVVSVADLEAAVLADVKGEEAVSGEKE